MISNFVIQYSWDNHKFMCQKELVEEFLKLPLYGKIQVYRILHPNRKVVLRKGYDRYKREKQREKQQQIEEARKEALYKKVETILSPFNECLAFEEITTDDVLRLTYAIIIKDGYAGYHDSYDPNSSKEEDSFNSTKEKMVAHIKRNEARDKMGEHTQAEIQKISDYYDALLYFLDDLKYTPKQKINYTLTPKIDRWKRMYEHIGVGKILSSKITKALSDFVTNKGLIGKYRKWQMDMNKTDFHWQALDTYNRADIATQDTDYPH